MSDKLPGGVPKPIVKNDYEYRLYCGGLGGGGCPLTVGLDRVTWAVKNDAFAVRNRLLLLRDEGRIFFYTDAGATAFCAHSEGARQPVYLAVSVDGNPTVAEIMAQNVVGGLQDPFELAFYEFGENLLPQPNDPGYDGNTYVTAYWGNANFVGFQMVAGYRLYETELNLHDVRI